MQIHGYVLAGAALALSSVLASGCQRYVAKPVDLSAHHGAWLARSPSDDRVSAYAQRLSEAGALEAPFDLADGVSLEEAEVVALVLNAELRVSRAEAGIAAATEENAGLWQDPTLGVDVLRVLANVQHPWISTANVGFTIPISGRLEKARALATAEHAAALQRVAEREWETVIALREAWIKWSAADEQIAVTRSYLDDLDGLISIVERMLEAGEMNRLNVRLFQIERLSTEQELALLEGARARLAIEIRQLMGLAPAADVALVPRLHSADALDASQAIDALVIERNPSLQTLLASYESSERALELEIRKQYPDIVIGPAHEYDSGTHRLGLGVSLPLPIFNANRLAIAQARAERERAMAALHAALEDVLSALAAADVDLDAAARRRRIVEEQIVPMVDAQFSDSREVARLGEVDTWLLLETLRTRFEVKQQLIELMREESAAAIARARLIGPAPIAIDELEIVP